MELKIVCHGAWKMLPIDQHNLAGPHSRRVGFTQDQKRHLVTSAPRVSSIQPHRLPQLFGAPGMRISNSLLSKHLLFSYSQEVRNITVDLRNQLDSLVKNGDSLGGL